MKVKRNGEIELLRFLFSIIIVLFHCNKDIFNYISPENYAYALAPRGYIGVEFFFMLSGYFMAAGIAKNRSTAPLGTDTFRFVWKKYLSIFPYHIIAFAALFTVHSLINWDFTIEKLLNVIPGALLITRSGIRFFDINGVEWYLSAMLLVMAAIYPVAKKHFDVYAKAIAPLSAILIYGWLIHDFKTLSGTTIWTAIGYRCMWRAAAGLNLGIFMYCCVQALTKQEWEKRDYTLAKIARAIIWIAVGVYTMCLNPKQYEIYAVIVIFIALTLTFSFPYRDVKWLDSKAVMFLGKFSLPLYLNQNLAIIIGKEYFSELPDVLLVLVILAMDGAFSALCYFLGSKLLSKMQNGKLNKIVLGIKNAGN